MKNAKYTPRAAKDSLEWSICKSRKAFEIYNKYKNNTLLMFGRQQLLIRHENMRIKIILYYFSSMLHIQ